MVFVFPEFLQSVKIPMSVVPNRGLPDALTRFHCSKISRAPLQKILVCFFDPSRHSESIGCLPVLTCTSVLQSSLLEISYELACICISPDLPT